MEPSIPVFEGMDVDEPERESSGGDNRVELPSGTRVKENKGVNQPLKVVGPCGDVLGQRQSGSPIALADESPLLPHSQPDESIISDKDALQAQEFIDAERIATRFGDGAPPPFDAGLRRALSFDGKARSGVSKKQECRCASKDIGRNATGGLSRAG